MQTATSEGFCHKIAKEEKCNQLKTGEINEIMFLMIKEFPAV